MIKKLLIYFFSIGSVSLSQAADLMDVYYQALENDPIYKAAYSTYMSKAEAIPQAQSALLPQLGMNGRLTRNQFIVQDTAFNGNLIYNGHQLMLNASQAIFNLQAWDNIQQAKASVKAAQAQYNDAAQNLILRVTQAYLDALMSRDTL